MLCSLFSADVQHAALLVAFVHAYHHALRIEADALALREAVGGVDAAEHALLAARRLHRLAHFLLVGAAGAPHRIGADHHAVRPPAHPVARLGPPLPLLPPHELPPPPPPPAPPPPQL